MKKIAYITERKPSLNNGSSTRDTRLLECLRTFFDVTVFYNDVSKHGKLRTILFSNAKLSKEIQKVINDEIYDHVIVSTFAMSPFYFSYSALNKNIIYYLCDSCFHMCQQALNLKYTIISYLCAWKEKIVLTRNKCAYLGEDEVLAIPKKYQGNALIFPFYIKYGNNVFDKNGFVTFIGDYSFEPNNVALQNILAFAKRSKLNFKLYGKNFDKNVKLPNNVEYVGFVENVIDAYKGARALIYPLNYGTGIKNKVIEAMSYGIPVIGFKEAYTNIDFDSKELFIKDFSSLTDELFFDLSSASKSSQLFIKEELNIKTISSITIRTLENISKT